MVPKKLPGKTSLGFGLSMIDRAVKEYYAERCKPADLRKIRAYFKSNGGLKCIYCGDSPKRWDHLHAVSKGGDTVPGNLVPACASCDDSKQNDDWETWIKGRKPKRPPRSQLPVIEGRVRAYRTAFPYKERRFRQKLSRQDKGRYGRFRGELDDLRRMLTDAGWLKHL